MPAIDTGDTAWVLVCTALVMFMAALAVVSMLWALVGHTLAFGADHAGLIGGLEHLGLRGIGAAPSALAPTVPASAFMAYQMMFAVITPALIAGAFAERMRFSGYLLFIGLWSLVVYAPLAHWVWGGGWLGAAGVGALDFAGGTVVHINAGIAALAAAVYLGKRRGFPSEAFVPHNVPMVITGAAILWFGWFGFNAGSALAANGLAASAFAATHIAAAAAVIGWLIPEVIRHGRPTTVGAATGAVAGLVAVTPAAGFVEPWAAVVIGLAAGAVCFAAVDLKSRIGYDDSLDVVGVHMVGGIVGALLTGVLASVAINELSAGANIGAQAIGVVATLAFSFLATLAILKIVDLLVGIRVTEEEEVTGLDLSQHAEMGYTFGDRGGQPVQPVVIPDTPPEDAAMPSREEAR